MCEARVISTPMGVHLCTGSYGRSVSWWNSGATQAVTGDQYPSGIQGLHWKSVTGDRYPCGSLQAALAVTGDLYPCGNSQAALEVTGDRYPCGSSQAALAVTGDQYPFWGSQAALAVTGEYPLGVHKLH